MCVCVCVLRCAREWVRESARVSVCACAHVRVCVRENQRTAKAGVKGPPACCGGSEGWSPFEAPPLGVWPPRPLRGRTGVNGTGGTTRGRREPGCGSGKGALEGGRWQPQGCHGLGEHPWDFTAGTQAGTTVHCGLSRSESISGATPQVGTGRWGPRRARRVFRAPTPGTRGLCPWGGEGACPSKAQR